MSRGPIGVVVIALAFTVGVVTADGAPVVAAPHARIGAHGTRGIETKALNAVIQRYCGTCHNPRQLKGNLSLEGFDVDSAPARLATAEKMIRKLRAQIMPPPTATSLSATYSASPFVSQHPWDHVEGAPYATRGGIVANHAFPADGMYSFRMDVRGGVGTKLEDVDVSIDGARIALLHYEKGTDRALSSADAPQGSDYV